MPRRSTKILRVCQSCGVEFSVLPCVVRRGQGKFCSHSCSLRGRTVSLEARYARYVGEETESGCWPWTGATHQGRYGIIGAGGKGGTALKAHRLAWEFANGPIPEGMYVCHHCDNPRCVNPSHLFLGLQTDNMADMVSKERQSRGEDHSHAKLTEEQVIYIREQARSGQRSQVQLAAEFGVRPDYLCKLVKGKYWRHIPL
jgi:hypothetical protein